MATNAIAEASAAALKPAIHKLRHRGLTTFLVSVGRAKIRKPVDTVFVEQLELDNIIAVGMREERFNDVVGRHGTERSGVGSDESKSAARTVQDRSEPLVTVT